MVRFQMKHVEGDKDLKIDFDKAKKGNQKEKEKILRKYLPLIKKEAKINGAIDEDLMQKMFLTMYNYTLEKYDSDKASFITFLFYRLKSCKYNYLKKKERDTHKSIDDDSNGETLKQLLVSDIDIEEEATRSLLINTTLKNFSKKVQYIIENYYIRDKTLNKIGEELEMTPQGVSWHLKKTKDKIKVEA